MQSGYIYVLKNPSFRPNLYKIGMTTRTAHDRAWEIFLGATGVPAPFQVAYTHPVTNCLVAEQRIHEKLSDFRFRRNREFFEIPLNSAVQVIKSICSDVNTAYQSKLPPERGPEEWVVVFQNDGQNPKQFSDPTRILVLRNIAEQRELEDSLISSIPSQTYIDWEMLIAAVFLSVAGVANLWLGSKGLESGNWPAIFFVLMGVGCLVAAVWHAARIARRSA